MCVLTLNTEVKLTNRSTKGSHYRPCMEIASRAVKGVSRGFCSSCHWVIPEKFRAGQWETLDPPPPQGVAQC